MTQNKLKVAVVGAGWAGQQHILGFSNNEHVELVAIAGMETEIIAKLAEEHNVKNTYQKWEDLLANEKLDAISIAVPTSLHAPIAIAALKKNVHVLSEKPMAKNLSEAQEMVKAAKENNRVLDIVFNHRRRGDIVALKHEIEKGVLGEVYRAHAAWHRRSGIPNIGSWFTDKETAGGGSLIDLGVHVIDFSLYLLGNAKAVSVSAQCFSRLGNMGVGSMSGYNAHGGTGTFNVEDLGFILIRCDNGALLTVEASWAEYREPGDKLILNLRGDKGGADIISDSKEPVADVKIFHGDAEGNEDYIVKAEPGPGHSGIVNEFVDIILSGEENWSNNRGQTGLHRAEILEAAYISSKLGREVKIAELENK